MPGMDHGETVVPLSPTGPGLYQGTGVLVMPGRWEATVRVVGPTGTVRAVVSLRVQR